MFKKEKIQSSHPGQISYKQAATDLHRRGFTPVPIRPNSKITATKWKPWENDLTTEKIRSYWGKHPDHELGILTNKHLIVFDVDSEESHSAFLDLVEAFGMKSRYIVTTKHGEHHYFNRPDSVFAKQQSFHSKEHPSRIDIKTDRSLVISPPSTGKVVKLDEINHVDELSSVTQEFIDAIFEHNGSPPPRPLKVAEPVRKTRYNPPDIPAAQSNNRNPSLATKLLAHINPDIGYGEWFIVAAGLHHEFEGSNAGLEVFDSWSKSGTKYTSRENIETMWRSINNEGGQ